jgi:hypothetical protein
VIIAEIFNFLGVVDGGVVEEKDRVVPGKGIHQGKLSGEGLL